MHFSPGKAHALRRFTHIENTQRPTFPHLHTASKHTDPTRIPRVSHFLAFPGAFSANLQTKIALAAIALDAPTARATVGLDTAIHASLTGDTVELKNGR